MYDFLRDQGSLIAGLLALLAGVLAYLAGIKQAGAAREQSIQAREQERRQAGQRILSAGALFDGVLTQFKGETDRLMIKLMLPGYNHADAVVAYDVVRNLALPPIGTVWNELGLFLPDTVRAYFQLDFRITDMRGRFPMPATELRDELRKLQRILDFLFDEIRKMVDRYGIAALRILDDEARRLIKRDGLG
jgi:hypothetical protein